MKNSTGENLPRSPKQPTIQQRTARISLSNVPRFGLRVCVYLTRGHKTSSTYATSSCQRTARNDRQRHHWFTLEMLSLTCKNTCNNIAARKATHISKHGLFNFDSSVWLCWSDRVKVKIPRLSASESVIRGKRGPLPSLGQIQRTQALSSILVPKRIVQSWICWRPHFALRSVHFCVLVWRFPWNATMHGTR